MKLGADGIEAVGGKVEVEELRPLSAPHVGDDTEGNPNLLVYPVSKLGCFQGE